MEMEDYEKMEFLNRIAVLENIVEKLSNKVDEQEQAILTFNEVTERLINTVKNLVIESSDNAEDDSQDAEETKSSVGVYRVVNNELQEIEIQSKLSYNSIVNELGYNYDEVTNPFISDSDLVYNIGVRIFTKDPLFVIAKDKKAHISMSQIYGELNNIDWDDEYSSEKIEDILEEGIKNKSLSRDFLSSVTTLLSHNNDYFAQDLDLILHFEDGLLVSFSSLDGLSAISKEFRQRNEDLFNDMMDEAKYYQKSDFDISKELNLQCWALWHIPDGFSNEHIEDHINSRGNYNLYNLYLAHYGSKSENTRDDFSLVNRGRFQELSPNEFLVDNYIYRFNNNHLEDVRNY